MEIPTYTCDIVYCTLAPYLRLANGANLRPAGVIALALVLCHAVMRHVRCSKGSVRCCL
ncbi:hypothetical protein N657DRAFT_134482 [Parathielavia appendiculata]|uniref:Uncharacterized protein n=1 Tax=Parathielavia appendiculata TaxID=2587402 RepID=A0AAN6TUT8_9PEZI|nr:hypothetical protein N657DRAFT_134482 [Parathielavia appendiculata]